MTTQSSTQAKHLKNPCHMTTQSSTRQDKSSTQDKHLKNPCHMTTQSSTQDKSSKESLSHDNTIIYTRQTSK
jgi:hypothetical protein